MEITSGTQAVDKTVLTVDHVKKFVNCFADILSEKHGAKVTITLKDDAEIERRLRK